MTKSDDHAQPSGAAKLGWGVYQQVAAVLGAFGLAAILDHFFDVGWRSYLQTRVGYWDQHVRTAVTTLFDVLVSKPLMWAFGWKFEVPLLVRDYFAVGLVLALSIFRANRVVPGGLSIRTGKLAPGRLYGKPLEVTRVSHPRDALAVLMWPYTLVFQFYRGGYFLNRYIWGKRTPVTEFAELIYSSPYDETDRAIHLALTGSVVRRALLTVAPVLYLGLLFGINYFVL